MALVYGKQLPGYLQLVALLGCQVTLSIAALSIAAFQCMGSADDTIRFPTSWKPRKTATSWHTHATGPQFMKTVVFELSFHT